MEVIYATPKIKIFIRKLEKPLIARVERTIDLLAQYGNELRPPHSKPLGKGLFELRLLGGHQVRVIYTFHRNQAFLLHIFMKKIRAISRKDLEYALRVKKTIA